MEMVVREPTFGFWEELTKKGAGGEEEELTAERLLQSTGFISTKALTLIQVALSNQRDRVSHGDVLSCLKKLLQRPVDPGTTSQHTRLVNSKS